MPTVTQHSSRLTIHTRKYEPALPVNSSGYASVSRGAEPGADSAVPLAGCGCIGFSLGADAQCNSGLSDRRPGLEAAPRHPTNAPAWQQGSRQGSDGAELHYPDPALARRV